jgi:prepilin-type N-terminal cleavage/methylation domain-containing protein
MKFPSLLKRRKPLKGFSLIELAISLIIVGLLMGFALKGNDLYQSAKLQSLMDQVDQFRLAHFTFQEQYSALPGDFNQASSVLDNDASDGNGDWIIGGDGLEEGSEAYSYWQHLYYASLLSAPLPQKWPSSKLGGIFVVEMDGENRPGIWYGLQTFTGDGVLTPAQAYSLNKKFDNGNPSSGRIRSETGANGREGKACCVDEKYNLAETSPVCILYFQL